MKTTIIAQPLTKAAFKPYGSVIEPYSDEEKTPENSWDINRGYACRHDSITKVALDGGEVGLSIFRTK
ncbi:ureidoglycolate lyase, partial [Psychrobacter sp. 1U2]